MTAFSEPHLHSSFCVVVASHYPYLPFNQFRLDVPSASFLIQNYKNKSDTLKPHKRPEWLCILNFHSPPGASVHSGALILRKTEDVEPHYMFTC